MSIENKLTYLEGTKTAIKDAIVAKGVAIDDNATFRSYATSINQISGTSITVDDALSSTSENPVQNKVIYNKLLEYSPLLNDKTGFNNTGRIATVNNNSLLSNDNVNTSSIYHIPQEYIDVYSYNNAIYDNLNFQNVVEKVNLSLHTAGKTGYQSDKVIINEEGLNLFAELNKDFLVKWFKKKHEQGTFDEIVTEFRYKKSKSGNNYFIFFNFNSNNYNDGGGEYFFVVDDFTISASGPVSVVYRNKILVDKIATWEMNFDLDGENVIDFRFNIRYETTDEYDSATDYKFLDSNYYIGSSVIMDYNDDSGNQINLPHNYYDAAFNDKLFYFYKITDYNLIWTNQNNFYIPIEKVYKLQEALDSKQSEIDSLKTNINGLITRIEALEAYHPA